jgi:hypothetical protein
LLSPYRWASLVTALIAREYPCPHCDLSLYLPARGFELWAGARPSTILMLVTTAGMLAIERFRIADIGEF